MKRLAWRSFLVAAIAMLVAWALHTSVFLLPLALGLAALVLFVTSFVPNVGAAWIEAIVHLVRSVVWRREQGHFHSHAGVPVRVHDDGRHVWIDGESLQRILGSKDSEDVLAARHAGHWRRFDDKVLMLRVDAVVRYLATAPSRQEPRILRLRQWLERELLFPAAERRRRRHPSA